MASNKQKIAELAKKLNAKQLKVAHEMLAGATATEAYIKAGYKGKKPHVNVAQIITNHNFQEYLNAHKEAAAEKTGITLEWWLERVKIEAERDEEGAAHSARVSALKLAQDYLNQQKGTDDLDSFKSFMDKFDE